MFSDIYESILFSYVINTVWQRFAYIRYKFTLFVFRVSWKTEDFFNVSTFVAVYTSTRGKRQ
jgi:hypothetical protein